MTVDPKLIDIPRMADGTPRFARGWHMIGQSSEFEQGKAKSLSYFGTKIAAYRGDDGKVYALDGYCPHLGADLADGCVEGSALRCPFHDWRWTSEGVCDDIPYADIIPKKAMTKSWPVSEVNGLVFIWNCPENSQPTYEIPVIEQVGDVQWTDWIIECNDIPTHERELVDNVADAGHFGPVHGSPTQYFANIFDGVEATQIMRGNSEYLSVETGLLTTEATYYGPGVQFTRMSGDEETVLLNAHTPVNEGLFHLWFGVLVLKKGSELEAQAIANAYVDNARAAFYQDVAIWKNKKFITNPVMCNGDGPLAALRKWYAQFYTDVDQVEVPADPVKWEKQYA